jgi:two-component system repressor protein LuxO
MIERHAPALAVVDLTLGRHRRLKILEAIRDGGLPTKVVVISGDNSLELSVAAMKLGAVDYLPEPFEPDRLLAILNSVLGSAERNSHTVGTVETETADREFAALAPRSQNICKSIAAAAGSSAHALMVGRNGFGKELCASAIHAHSARKAQPFLSINCAAIPSSLIEAEIFGHVTGAFPGILSDRYGSLIEAHKGTLFLDEICELDPAMQTKLLRALRYGTYQRQGSPRLEEVDIRIVVGISGDPDMDIAEGRLAPELAAYLREDAIRLDLDFERPSDSVDIAKYFLFSARDTLVASIVPADGHLPTAENIVAA